MGRRRAQFVAALRRRRRQREPLSVERRMTRLEVRSYFLYAFGLALVIVAAWFARAQADDTASVASTAQRAASTARVAAGDAKAASSRTRVLAVDLASNARVAKILADQLNRAVCAWRGDLKQRVRTERRSIRQTERFLRDNPAGIPGIPPRLLRQGLDQRKATLRNLRSTVRAFATIDCAAAARG